MPKPYERTLTEVSPEDFLAEHDRRLAQTFEVGEFVRLADGVGTKAQRALVWRVEALHPVRDRMDYDLKPVTGGRGTRAQALHLDPASEADKARAVAVPLAPDVCVGNVVTVGPRTLRGHNDADRRFVVLKVNTDGTASVAYLGGDGGRYYPKCPIAAMRIVPAV